MLRMPIIHTSASTYLPTPWQRTATPIDQYGQADCTTPTNLIWHGDQTSAVQYFKEVESDPIDKKLAIPTPFVRSFGLLRKFAFAALASCFLFIGGCKKFEVTATEIEDEAKPSGNPHMIGTGRTRAAAENEMWRIANWFISPKNPDNPIRLQCHTKEIHYKMVGKVKCRKVKRRLHKCWFLWSEIYCRVKGARIKALNPNF